MNIKTNRKISQDKLIINYLKSGESLTPLDALKMFNCFRLGARIFDLKKNGHDIITKITTIKEIPTISSHFIVEKDFHETIKNISYLLYGYAIETKEINQIFIEIINKHFSYIST